LHARWASNFRFPDGVNQRGRHLVIVFAAANRPVEDPS
jgi:hypothetical protein